MNTIPTPTSTQIKTRINWLQTTMIFVATFIACISAMACVYFFIKWKAKEAMLKQALDNDVHEPPLAPVSKPVVPPATGQSAQKPITEQTTAELNRIAMLSENLANEATTALKNTQGFVGRPDDAPRANNGRFVKTKPSDLN